MRIARTASGCRRTAHLNRGEKGFTIIELAFAMATSLVVLAAAYIVSASVSVSSVELVAGLESIRGSIETVNRVRGDLARARIISLEPDGSSITYRLPIPPPEGQPILDENGDIRWGFSDGRGTREGGFGRLEFLPERVRNEKDERRDLNEDGDRKDVFEEGRLRLTTDAGDELGVKRVRLLFVKGDRGADVDGDGTPDPLFSITANDVVVMQLPYLLDTGGVRVQSTKMRPVECEVKQ
jgi:hypothetical protein